MAETAGLVLGALGVAGLISVCLDCYNFVQDGRSVGQSYAQFEADMSHQSVRLFAWAKACGYMTVQGPDPRLGGEWERHVKMQLNCIALLFLDAQKLTGRYHVVDDLASRSSIGSSVVAANSQFFEAGLNDALSSIRKTKKKAGLRGFFTFGLRDKKRCEETVQNLEKCLTALEFVAQNLDLFQLENDIIKHEIETSTDVDALQSMVVARPGSDQASLISDAASQRIRLLEDAMTVSSGPTSWGGERQTFVTAPSQLSRIEEDGRVGERVESVTGEGPLRDGQEGITQPDVGQNVRIMRELLKNGEEEKPTPHLDDKGWGDRLKTLKLRDKEELEAFSGVGTISSKRIAGEIRAFLKDDSLAWMSMRFLESSAAETVARITFEGPPHSAYQGGIFHAAMTFDSHYPFLPPKLRLLTKIYHPNIDVDGKVCMDSLERLEARDAGWGPHMHISNILTGLTSLLTDPGVDDPLVPEIAQTYVLDRELYNHNARMVTAKYATTSQSYPRFGVGPELFEEEKAVAAE
ncbi:hypothetical protein GGTG_02436 [Gaeumannomyces tritici R3-111a-1]|uniref:UBC core domain-containing protein n=1 Tax=Gaeumannomyces tritici (strain R3-111a-1) TaxID=644352 RepID=J3NMD2_GAET3|nr:hypothetical protein GGTG_02436 [Gaeumannomyces tritici R3-111a-1]EJT82463.1 hypothetical protein GGTG_02436 [Gaeumannomyces tritici R3-111a-1]